MGGLMYLVPQGQNQAKMIQTLEKRVEALENLVKGLQLDVKPKVGRPPKVKNEPNQPESSNPSSD
jgi:hypothetical protein